MIDAKVLLAALTRQLKRLENDLRQRIAEVAGLNDALRAEWQAAHDADRTAETFESWAEQVITQAGVHWLLSCVFLRFVEDNALVERPWLGGRPDDGRLALARDRHETFFRAHPELNDRDYLLAAFREAGELPGLHTFFDEAHNPVFRLGISGDAAMALLQFWQQVDPNTGLLVFDFTDVELDTRFLGDLYQDLSEATRKRYALLQTPEFVEEFILDRTLTPALREFGLHEVRLIDPTCGSGHFLLGAFHRLVDEWARNEPGLNRREVAKRALNAVAGVDLNPFAVAIARFRLLVAALKVSDVQRLRDAPDFKLHVAIGDSLLHGRRFGLKATDDMFTNAEHYAGTGLAHTYATEDLHDVQEILGRQYHAVVGNPPYIVVKDAALNAAYRREYPESCHMKYSLGAPFTQRFFELAVTGKTGQGAGCVGLITANSFMRREFGTKLIEKLLPQLDLTHVVDCSGVVIPGHGTDTVILFGTHRTPFGETVRTVMGKKKEPSMPENPSKGLVWTAICNQIDVAGSESEFISVNDTRRSTLSRHPWSIGGGGAADLKEQVEQDRMTLISISESVGIAAFTLEDDIYVNPISVFLRKGISSSLLRDMVSGDEIRDWCRLPGDVALFPYDGDFQPLDLLSVNAAYKYMWPFKTCLANNMMFGKQTKVDAGLKWWEYGRLTHRKLRTPLAITFGEIASHNHFVLDRGGKIFNRTSPIIKLHADSNEHEHMGLLGLLNSSVACFWLKQVCQPKGAHLAGKRTREERYVFNASNVEEMPVSSSRPVDIATCLDALSKQFNTLQPVALTANGLLPTRTSLDAARAQATTLRYSMIAQQEELDWQCYRLYGLLPEGNGAEHTCSPPEVTLGERAFEIVLARRMAAGLEQTTWFERHGSTPITEIPKHWPEDYRRVVERRIELIESDRNIGLIERPEYKRRWNTLSWEEQEQAALHDWLLAHLEQPHYWPADPPQLTSTTKLADAAQRDAVFMQMAALYAGHADFDVGQLVAELVASEAVPYLPVLRYTDSGQRKRAQWEATWALQRQEDAIDAEVEAEAEGWRKQLQSEACDTWGSHEHPDAVKWIEKRLAEELANQKADRKANEVGKIPVPPKYQSKDFLKADFWRLRGGLDVPKERWISYPGAERGADGSLPVAWAGWNHLQQATALAGYYLDMKDNEGWPAERLQPLLAGLLELVPWLQQWHNEVHPEFGQRMGDYYASFVADEARGLGFTLEDLLAWKPAVVAAKRGRKPAATKR